MTTETLDALKITRAILPHLPGWEIDRTTGRNIAEADSVTRTWVAITNPAIPGSDISIHTSREKGKLSISASYPNGWEPYDYQKWGGRHYRESINVSASKSPEALAREIQRRLLDATGYLANLAECIARKEESEQGYDNAEATARELAEMIGTRTEYDSAHKWEIDNRKDGFCSHRKTDDNRKRFSYADSNYETRVEGEVSHGAKTVKLTLSNLTPAQARKVLAAWKAAR